MSAGGGRHQTIEGAAGAIEIAYAVPAEPRALAVIAHPHPLFGGTMDNKVVTTLARIFAGEGAATFRFNFRGVGSSAGSFDAGPGEFEDFQAALDEMTRWYPGLPLWAAGFSFGAWVALEVGAQDPRVSVLIGVAPPVAKTEYVFAHVRTSPKPKFIVQGSLDEICPIKALWAFYATLDEPKELAVIDGADHLFTGRTPEVGEALEDLLTDFEG